MELVNGRPENEEGRLEKEIRVYDLLDSLGVKYQRIDHEAAMTMEACEEIDRTLSEGEEKGVAICKNLFLCNRQRTEFYLLTMPGNKPFQTKVLSAQLKELAADGLIARHDYAQVPPRVDYTLTERGEALMAVFDAMQQYIHRYGVELPAASGSPA